MLDIPKRYAISPANMGKRAATATGQEQEDVKILLHLHPHLVKDVDEEAERCGRARMRQIEAILAAYYGYDVELRDMTKVRAVVKRRGRGPLRTSKGAKTEDAEKGAGQEGGKK